MTNITMPKLTDGREPVRINRWMKDVGDPVRTGDILFQATPPGATEPVEVKSEHSGTLREITVAAGQTAHAGDLLATFG